MKIKETHPCFTASCSDYARIHLPVAPECNIQCNYCLRKFCCVNESRPGVVAKVMSPLEALAWYLRMKSCVPRLTVAGIAGPGDSLANWAQVRETLLLIREADKTVLFCLSTNGLLLPQYAMELAALGVAYVTVTVNAFHSEIGAQIYSYVRDGSRVYRGKEAAQLLLERQLEGIRLLQEQGVQLKINTVAINGVNMDDIPIIAAQMATLGCRLHNILPMLPVAGTQFANLAEPSAEVIDAMRDKCSCSLPQMRHCNRCRADAVGALVNPQCFRQAK